MRSVFPAEGGGCALLTGLCVCVLSKTPEIPSVLSLMLGTKVCSVVFARGMTGLGNLRVGGAVLQQTRRSGLSWIHE